MALSDMGISDFTALLASDAPAPGGGSAAALVGAMGAALTAMVAGLTQGRKKYADYADRAADAERQLNALRRRLLDIMEQDTAAFQTVSAAFSLPRETESQRTARSSAIQEGLQRCTEAPLETMALTAEAIALAGELAEGFNESAASDLGTAFLAFRAAALGAWLNVCINISSLQDRTLAEQYRARGEALLARSLEPADRGYQQVLERIGR